MDDLVFSGAGSGCNNEDDEDECPPLLEVGSGDDDLITPVYVPTIKPSTTTRAPNTSTQGPGGKPCDDEDCFPGSGSGEVTVEETTVTFQGTDVTSALAQFTTDIQGTTFDTSEKSTTVINIINSSELSTTVEGSTTTITTQGSTTTEQIALPPYPHIPDIPKTTYGPPPSSRPRERINSETSEIVALVIGIIAGALIAIILIILVILKFKSHSDRSYKVDDGKTYQHGPNTALLGSANTTNGHRQYQMNGSLRNGTEKNGQMQKKKRESKDIKEWYV